MTVPRHIYVAFNTGVPAREYRTVHPERDLVMVVGDEVWVPVEITLIGRGSSLDAWRTGVREWIEAPESMRGFHRTRDARELYSPVVLTQTDLGLQLHDHFGRALRLLAASGKDQDGREHQHGGDAGDAARAVAGAAP